MVGAKFGPSNRSAFLHPVPRLKHETLGAIFVVEADFLLFHDAERFRGIIFALNLGGVEDITLLFFSQAAFPCEENLQFATRLSAAFFVPSEGATDIS